MLAGSLVLGFSACKKDRTCTCTGQDGDVEVTKYKKISRFKAKDQCPEEIRYTDNGQTQTTTCKLN